MMWDEKMEWQGDDEDDDVLFAIKQLNGVPRMMMVVTGAASHIIIVIVLSLNFSKKTTKNAECVTDGTMKLMPVWTCQNTVALCSKQ